MQKTQVLITVPDTLVREKAKGLNLTERSVIQLISAD